MAARSVLKLLSKTCSYSLNSSYHSSQCASRSLGDPAKSHRSVSQPSRARHRLLDVPFQDGNTRRFSRSLENLRGRYSETPEDIEEDRYSYRESARKFEEAKPVYRTNLLTAYKDPPRIRREEQRAVEEEEQAEEQFPASSGFVYELEDSNRERLDTQSLKNYFDVFDYMRRQESNRVQKAFPHLQPSNLKPYGSTESIYVQDGLHKSKTKVVYPVVNTTERKVDTFQHNKQYSSYMQGKEYPGYEEAPQNRMAVYEDEPKKTYSGGSISGSNNKDTFLTSRRQFQFKSFHTKNKSDAKRILATGEEPGVEQHTPKKTFSSGSLKQKDTFVTSRKHFQFKYLHTMNKEHEEKKKSYSTAAVKSGSDSASVGRGSSNYKPPEDVTLTGTRCTLCHKFAFNPSNERSRRHYNTFANKNEPSDPEKCSAYVTVKLSEIDEECCCKRKIRCKPKKIKFGRLPKLTPKDCACIEDKPMKEGNPLLRLKKRSEPKEMAVRECNVLICADPRADDNYKIVPKTLRPIIPGDCPCVEREYTDFQIRRLPKREIPEPPKICPCVDTFETCCNAERADGLIKVEPKTLPKLPVNNCPCIEKPEMKDFNIKRLKPRPVAEVTTKCIIEHCVTPRADEGMKITRKQLPILKPKCICIEPPAVLDTPPLPRLKRVKFPSPPPRKCPIEGCDPEIKRADADLKMTPKKLPKFVPKNCPCIEKEPPSKSFNFKRLQMRNVPKEKEKICLTEHCGARADDGLVIKPKQLPVLEPKPCPCVEETYLDVPPLKRLVPRPVVEPIKDCPCPPEICCERPKVLVERKKLPVLPPGSCPCIEPEPMIDAKPLAKLKKRKVVSIKPVCKVEECDTPRADANLKIGPRKLPVLKTPDCPCIEAKPPEDVKPLTRLPKVCVPEPPRICVKEECDETTRADEGDWLYWKRVEVKCDDDKSSTSKTSKRQYTTSTTASRSSTEFPLKYELAKLHMNPKEPCNVFIDLTGKCKAPLDKQPIDYVAFVVYKQPKNITKNNVSPQGSKTLVMNEPNDTSLLFNSISRFISTCSTLHHENHLQPKNPIIKQKETFIKPFPDDDTISYSARRGRSIERTRNDCDDKDNERCEAAPKCPEDEVQAKVCRQVEETEEECRKRMLKEQKECADAKKMEEAKKDGLWDRVVNYFKARPGCPSPEEFKKMRLKEQAEKAASKAGLCLYDPKEMLKRNERDLPKVITAAGRCEGKKE